jgi:thiol-disulfide isomerase/thioredoxin
MRRTNVVLTMACCASTFGLAAVAQETAPARFAALDALNATHERQLCELECRQISDLASLAEKTAGPEQDAVYRQLFRLAIGRNHCPEAMAAAGHCLATTSCGQEARTLAALARALAQAEKGEHDRALADLKALFRQSVADSQSGGRANPEMALAVGEAFLRRLIHDGQYDVARKLCVLACEGDAPAELKDHFEDRMGRLDLLGKTAPAVVGTDVDGKPVSLADLKGKVVLVDFWATWCPPCVASIPTLSALAQKHQDRGFVILGVNVDAMHEDVKEAKTALMVVRRFLVKHRIPWTNLMSGQDKADFAAAYQVEQIPANFLVGRDGKIVAVEQSGEMLERAIVNALKGDQP